jgi:hypothetical protein
MKPDIAVGIVLIGVFIVFFSFMFGFLAGTEDMRKEALRYEAAHYDMTTGKFTWNNEIEIPKNYD